MFWCLTKWPLHCPSPSTHENDSVVVASRSQTNGSFLEQTPSFHLLFSAVPYWLTQFSPVPPFGSFALKFFHEMAWPLVSAHVPSTPTSDTPIQMGCVFLETTLMASTSAWFRGTASTRPRPVQWAFASVQFFAVATNVYLAPTKR